MFPFNQFPQRVGRKPKDIYRHLLITVFIQLVSPTSGERGLLMQQMLDPSFHSISFPNEWGEHTLVPLRQPYHVSIQLVSPTSGELKANHSSLLPPSEREIKFPFNQFPQRVGRADLWWIGGTANSVSIQLVSPTSGEYLIFSKTNLEFSFHSISFPNEWGAYYKLAIYEYSLSNLFPFNQFPQRVGSGKDTKEVNYAATCVSIQLVSPTSGETSMIHPRQRKVFSWGGDKEAQEIDRIRVAARIPC